MHVLLAATVAAIGVLGTQPARAQVSASTSASVTILEPVGVGESGALALSTVAAPPKGEASAALHGSFALDGSTGRTVSVASSAGPLTHANGRDRLSLDVRTNRFGSDVEILGAATARAGATPGLYAGAVSVVVNYN
jgi:hypothetical protein